MPFLTELQVLGVKSETTQNTPATLASGDFLQAPTTFYEPDVEEIKRDFARQSMDSVSSIRGRSFGDISYKIPLKGSGTAGTAWAPLAATLLACGFVALPSTGATGVNATTVTVPGSGYILPPTITAATGTGGLFRAVINNGALVAVLIIQSGTGYGAGSFTITGGGGTSAAATYTVGNTITYSVTSVSAANHFTVGQAATVELYRGATTNAIKTVLKGAVGKSWKFGVSAGGLGYLEVGLRGMYVAPTTATPIATTYNNTIEPICQSSFLNAMGYSPIAQKIDIDLGLKIASREDLNQPYGIGGFMITGRDPKFSFDPEVDTLTNQDFIGKMIAGTEGAAGFKLGSVAGNTIWATMPAVQYSKVKFVDRNGIMCYNIDGQLNQATGDDSLNLVFV